MPTNADLGVALRRLRRDQERTIEDVAFAADVHPTYLSGIERGVRNPTWAKLCVLATALNVSITALARCAEAEATSPTVFARPDRSWTPTSSAAKKSQRIAADVRRNRAALSTASKSVGRFGPLTVIYRKECERAFP
jgi:transcriptional regulator with XRE-family HTH domain